MSVSTKPFAVALKQIMDKEHISYMSLSELTKTADHTQKGLSHGYLNNLVRGLKKPTIQNIELIATALRLPATHFREYREHLVATEAKLLAQKYGFDEIMERLRTVAKEQGPPKNK